MQDSSKCAISFPFLNFSLQPRPFLREEKQWQQIRIYHESQYVGVFYFL